MLMWSNFQPFSKRQLTWSKFLPKWEAASPASPAAYKAKARALYDAVGEQLTRRKSDG